jgi:uncharacterized RDD family membrane protein YckC
VEEIVTGEAVILDLPVARFPTRMLARIIDMAAQLVLFFAIFFTAALAEISDSLDSAATAAVLVTGIVVTLVGYPVALETLSRGRTLGKLALGLRVVADDGGPVRFRQALVRALAGVVECWGLAGIPALITAMLSARGKRLGDIFAGTFVVRMRAPRSAAGRYQAGAYAAGGYQAAAYGTGGYQAGGYQAGGYQAGGYPAGGYPAGGYPAGGYPAGGYPAGGYPAGGYGAGFGATGMPADPALQPWAATLDVSGLPESLAASAASYLSRYWQLDARVRDQLGWQLASDIATRVSPPPPPGLPPVAYLNGVLAQRRNRELARLWAVSNPPVVSQPVVSQPVVSAPVMPAPPSASPPSASPPLASSPPDSEGFAPPA